MPQGTLEVLLVSAKGLENTEFLKNMDSYVVFTCRTQEQKSSVAAGQGSNPEWNETFSFTISATVPNLQLKIFDSDWGTDDFVGEATIPLEAVFEQGNIPPTSYNVVKDEKYCGQIRIGLSFTQQECGDRRLNVEYESMGGWKESTQTQHGGGGLNNEEGGYGERRDHRRHGYHAGDYEEISGGRGESAYRERGYRAEEESFGGWKESGYRN